MFASKGTDVFYGCVVSCSCVVRYGEAWYESQRKSKDANYDISGGQTNMQGSLSMTCSYGHTSHFCVQGSPVISLSVCQGTAYN